MMFTPEEIGNDCFDLSLKGHWKLATSPRSQIDARQASHVVAFEALADHKLGLFLGHGFERKGRLSHYPASGFSPIAFAGWVIITCGMNQLMEQKHFLFNW